MHCPGAIVHVHKWTTVVLMVRTTEDESDGCPSSLHRAPTKKALRRTTTSAPRIPASNASLPPSKPSGCPFMVEWQCSITCSLRLFDACLDRDFLPTWTSSSTSRWGSSQKEGVEGFEKRCPTPRKRPGVINLNSRTSSIADG